MKRLTLVAILLVSAAVACVGALPGPDDVDPTSEFPTATPGGRISISLLTPTQTFVPYQGEDEQVIGPVATQTALFEQQATQTASVVEATPTLAGVFAQPALCPEQANPTLPADTPAFSQFAPTIAAYLSAGGPPTVLEASLRGWQAINEQGGLVIADRDLTADGVPEVMVVVFDPNALEDFPQPGDLYVFGCDDRAYRLLYRAGFEPEEGLPQPLVAEDMNGNLIRDLAYMRQTCDGLTCSQEVTVIEWSLDLGSFETLTSEPIEEPFAEVSIRDLETDTIQEIIVNSGTLASVAAGPQRVFTEIWRWDSSVGLYVLDERTGEDTEYRIHVLHDADDAFADDNYNAAIQLYTRAIENDTLEAWEYPDETTHLQTYARYRLMMAWVMNGDPESGRTTFSALYEDFYDTTPDADGDTLIIQPGVALFQMAELWWTTYLETGEPAAGCEAVRGYVATNPLAIEVLNSFGFANPTYTAVDVCPLF